MITGSAGGGGSTDVTGSDNFFVKNILQISGTIVNPVGHLILSSTAGSVIAISGGLKIIGSVTSADLDLRYVLTSSLATSVNTISDNRYVSNLNGYSGSLQILAGPNITINSGSGFIMITGSAGGGGGGTGDVVGPNGATSGTIPRLSSSGKALLTSSIIIGDNDEFYNYRASVVLITASDYNLSMMDTGKILEVSNSGGFNRVFLPNNLSGGWNATIVQKAQIGTSASGTIIFSRSLGSQMTSFASLSKSAGLGAFMTLYVSTNIGGVSASYFLGGNLV